MTSKVRPKFIETETEIKQSAATINKDLVLNKSLKLTNDGIFRYNNGFIEFSFNGGTSWYQLGDKLKEWVSAKAYAVNDTVIYLDKIYRCDIANSDVVFVDDNWTAIGGGTGGGGSAQTGLLTGGSLSINANNTSVDVTAIVARVVDDYTDPTNPVTYDLNIDATNVPITNVATAGLTYLYIDKTGAFVQSSTQLNNSQMRDHILLGAIIHTVGGVINAINNVTEGVVNGLGLAFLDLQRQQGVRNYEGNIFTPAVGNPLGFDKTEGKILFFGGNYKIDPKSPNTPSSAALANPQFFTTWRNGSGGWNNLLTQSIAPNLYDDGTGTLATVANNRWTAKRLYLVQSGIVVQHAQGQFASRIGALNDAQYGSFDLNPDLRENALFVGWILTSGADTGWVSSNLVLSSTGSAGASAAVTLNSWGVINITTAQSPYTVTSTRKFILVDASGGPVTVKLQDVSSGTADWETRIYMVDNTNPVTVTTVGGSQLIGDSTTQKIFQDNEGFSVVADFANLKYVITQDNRKDTTFKTPQHTWALFKNYPAVDLTNSNLVGGSSVAGDNHYVTMTTGTTAGAYFVSIPVSSEEILQVRNFFRFLFTTAIINQFSVGVQGFNGSTWTDLGTQELGIGDKSWGLISFDLGSYVSYRIKVSQLGTTAGRTITISRGEWTDEFSKIVEVGAAYPTVTKTLSGNITTSTTMADLTISDLVIGRAYILSYKFVVNDSDSGISNVIIGINNGATTLAQARAATHNTANVDTSCVIEFTASSSSLTFVSSIQANSSILGNGTTQQSFIQLTRKPDVNLGYQGSGTFDIKDLQYPSYDHSPNAQAGRTDIYSRITPYKTKDGQLRAIIDWKGYFSSVVGSFALDFSGTIFKSYATVENYQQRAVAGSTATSDVNAYFDGGTPSCRVYSTPAQANFAIWADVELESWPTWATLGTSIQPLNVIAPVSVIYDTEWQNYTPVFTNLGTVSAIDVKWRRVGSQLEISGTWTNGTVSAGSAAITLPSIVPTLPAGTKIVGSYGSQGSIGNGPAVLNGSAKSIFFGQGNWQVAATGTQLASSGFMSMFATIPVLEWGATDTQYYALHESQVHKNATYLSSNETEAGWSENRGKQIYKRTIYFPSDVTNNSTYLNLGTGITPINHHNHSSSSWLISLVSFGTSFSQVAYNKATGYIDVSSSSWKVGAGTELEFFYTKD